MEDEDKDIYSDEGREELTEDDEISPTEEGFMKGAEGLGQGAKCRYCGRILIEPEDVVEREVNGDVFMFCSDKCAKKYLKKEKG